MKLLLPNQHGAWVMALLPFIYAQWITPFVWQSTFLLLGFIALQFLTYPFLALFKGRNLAYYAKWTAGYGLITVLLFIPALIYNWEILYFLIACTPFILVNIYYTRTRNERALLNDIAGIIIFGIFAMGAYYFTTYALNYNVAIYPSLFFIGTTFYVKAMLRERKNPKYYWLNITWHVGTLIYFFIQSTVLGISFIPILIRSIMIPRFKFSAKQIGMAEFGFSLIFFIGLLYS